MNNIYDELKEKKFKRNGTIGLIVVIIWIVSLIGLFFIPDVFYKIVCLGVFIFGFNFLIFINAEELLGKYISFPFMLFGLSCIIIPIFNNYPEIFPFVMNWDIDLLAVVLICILVFGVFTLLFPFIMHGHLNRVCTYSISATIIGYKCRRKGRHILYSPIYSFYYDDKDWEVMNYVTTGRKDKPVGSIVDLKINPNNPEEIMVVGCKEDWLAIIVGILIIVIVLPIFIYILN